MISIIVPSSGDIFSVKRLCDSLMRQKIKEDIEVYVVAHPESREIQDLMSRYPSNFYYLSSDGGENSARNRGLRESRGRLLYFFRDDCILPWESYLAEGVEYMDLVTDCKGYGGFTRPYQSLKTKLTEFDKAYGLTQNRCLMDGKNPEGDECLQLDASNMILRRELFDRHGLFNEELVFGGTETEFFSRFHDEQLILNSQRFVWQSYDLTQWQFLQQAFLQGVGATFIRHKPTQWHRSQITYGNAATAQMLELPPASDAAMDQYKWAFLVGARFYEKHKTCDVPKSKIARELFKDFALRAKQKYQRSLNDLLCIMDNLSKS